MTWKEFKEEVEALGVKDDDQVDYIDIEGVWPIAVSRDDGHVQLDRA